MYVSDLLGGVIRDEQRHRVGRLNDLVARVDGAEQPRIVGALTRRHAHRRFLAVEHLRRLEPGAMVVARSQWQDYTRRDQQVLLGRDVMDSRVVYLDAHRPMRVNDVVIEREENEWRVYGVDLRLAALPRRLLPRALRGAPRGTESQVVPWPGIELLASEVPGQMVTPDHRRLARLHPADIARVADAVSTHQATEIVASLDDDLAADTLEEMIEERQANVIEALDPPHGARLLEQMAPDKAADVLALLQPEVVAAVLQLMAPAHAADLHALLTYPKETAGGLMTTDYVIVPRGLQVDEVIATIKPRLVRPDWVYYVYVVQDERERRLLGVASLRDLMLAQPDRLIDDVMTIVPRRVDPTAPASAVAQVMSEYNLTALPVTDGANRLLGIVSVDDALAVILPRDLRRRLPRVFS